MIEIGGSTVKVAVCSGAANARPILESIRAGKSEYAFVEIMGCPGGCLNGGGQPFVKPTLLPREGKDILDTYLEKRAAILYGIDERKKIRQSHNNPEVQALYKEFLGEPGSEKAERLLHTSYRKDRERYPR